MTGHDGPHGMVGIRRRAEQGRAAARSAPRTGSHQNLISGNQTNSRVRLASRVTSGSFGRQSRLGSFGRAATRILRRPRHDRPEAQWTMGILPHLCRPDHLDVNPLRSSCPQLPANNRAISAACSCSAAAAARSIWSIVAWTSATRSAKASCSRRGGLGSVKLRSSLALIFA
jgi:hypothetical protein